MRKDSPKPLSEEQLDAGLDEAFIEYAPVGENLEHVPITVRPQLHYYMARMGFLPNTLKLYLHVPWIAEHIFKLNNAVMRDERNALSEHLKYRLSLLASRDNECPYCTSHNVLTLKRRWQYEDADIEDVLHLEPQDEQEAVAMGFVHQACLDPAGVTNEMRSRLAEHFSPQEVMEIVLIVGFWKMYNTMHLAMAAPIEEPAKEFRHWVNVHP